MDPGESSLVSSIRGLCTPFTGSDADYDSLVGLASEADLVLLGEATHGTHEFYDARCRITQRLLKEGGFAAVAVEADWPDAARVNRFVKAAQGAEAEAVDALGDFQRFPQWMWRNADILDFIGWLREFNDGLPDGGRKGFYGLDLYNMNASITAVLQYLDTVDPAAAHRARERYGCFQTYGADPERYGYAAGFDLESSCEAAVLAQLGELQRNAAVYAARDGRLAPDDQFFAEQNALLVANAEHYYRSMFLSNVSSWNLRDRHMFQMLDHLIAHLKGSGSSGKVVVWAHNSHLGDARFTEMSSQGELNIGQLVRERWGRRALLVGFSTYEGTVTAASSWGGPAERKQLRPALAGSFEALFHRADVSAFSLPSDPALFGDERRLERAVGVLYLPQTERWSHYFHAEIARQFDAVIHFDRTRAVEPLEAWAAIPAGAAPETFPTGQ